MKIQIISKRKFNFPLFEVTKSDFSDPKAFDMFDFNIIDLNSSQVWKYYYNSKESIDCIEDFYSIESLLKNNSKSNAIVVLPQALEFSYWRTSDGKSLHFCPLKDMIYNMKRIISSLYSKINELSIEYANNEITYGNENLKYYFGIKKDGDNPVSHTYLFQSKALYITGLDILESENKLISFFEMNRFVVREDCSIPEWLKNFNMFQDEQLKAELSFNQTQIKELEEKNENIVDQINENNKYKSILVTTGDDLVKQIFPMLEAMLDCNLRSFVDEKKQDFLIKKEGITFVGEIKGIGTNVKKGNISQTETHCIEYEDKLEEQGVKENIKGILIINHQREKEIAQREPIPEEQIALAVTKNVLIVETLTFLKLYEAFLGKKINVADVQKIFTENSGLLAEEDFKKD